MRMHVKRMQSLQGSEILQRQLLLPNDTLPFCHAKNLTWSSGVSSGVFHQRMEIILPAYINGKRPAFSSIDLSIIT